MTTADITTQEQKAEVEEAARVLVKAEEIKKDSQLYEAALAHLEMQQSALTEALGQNKSLREVIVQ